MGGRVVWRRGGIIRGVGRIGGRRRRVGLEEFGGDGPGEFIFGGRGNAFWSSVYRGFGVFAGLKKNVD